MGSTLIVDEIQGATTAANVQFPAGVVIQAVDTSNATQTTVQNTTFTDTGLILAITPKFATSKILVTCTQDVQGNAPKREQRYSVTPNPVGSSAPSSDDDNFGFNEEVSFFEDAKNYDESSGTDTDDA